MRWDRVTTGRSGMLVFRGPGLYRKEAVDARVDLREEAKRLTWLAVQGIPAADVLESERTVLVTTAVAGRTAAEPWPVEVRPRVVDALARLTRELHALPVDDCPFDRRLDVVVPEAMEADVDLSDLDPERRGWTRQELVDELVSRRPDDEDVVVCHGDLSLPNVLVDPATFEVTGVVDAGRLGVADRWTDLAIATRSLASPLNPQFGPWAAERYLAAYGIHPNRDKSAYYRLLDEFF